MPLPAPQRLLANALAWKTEFVVVTGFPKGVGIPTHYKIDIANPILRIGIEVDGRSHGVIERQIQDRKKEKFLQSVGWTVLRFSNAEVMANLSECVQMVQSTISKLKI